MIALALALLAPASNIVRQDIAVDFTHDDIHVVIDADIDLDGPLPMYGFVAPVVEATVDGARADVVVDPNPQYQGLVQWLMPLEANNRAARVHLVIDGPAACADRLNPGMNACTYRPGDDAEFVLLPETPGAAWHITNLYGADPFVGSVTVHAPGGLAVAAGQGTATSNTTLDDGSVVATFDLDVASETLGVYARADDSVTVAAGAARVIAFVPKSAGASARDPMSRVAAAGARVLPRYTEWFGPLPVDEIHYMPVSGRIAFGGMGLLGDIFLGDFITRPAFDYLVEQGAAHELAHSWWGGMTSADDPNEGPFLQEAFAEFSAWRALGVDDDNVRTAGARMNAVWYLTQIGDADVPIVDAANDQAAYVLVTYHKGSTVLRTLEERAGPDAFIAALHNLVARGQGGLTLDGLVDEVRASSGVDLTPDLDQWLHHAGHPTFRAGFDGKKLAIDVDGAFDLDVPVRAVSSDGTVTDVTTHASDNGPASLALSPHTVLVEIDPRWTMVRTVSPKLHGDVSLDGRVDAVDLMEIALRAGTYLPSQRRQDGGYDPLYDLDGDGVVDEADIDAALAP